MTPEEKIAHLEGQLKEVREESAERRVKSREMKVALDRATADLADRDRRIADFEAKQGKPSELQGRIDALTAENRQLKHSAKFRQLAGDAGVRPDALDDAWGVLGLKADADEPDEEALSAALEAAKTGKSYLFKTADDGKSADPPKAPPPPFGHGRGKDAPGSLRLTKEQRRDATFMSNNAAVINQHRQAGTLIYD